MFLNIHLTKQIVFFEFLATTGLAGGFSGPASVWTNGTPDTTNIWLTIGVMFDLQQAFDTLSINLFVLSNTNIIDSII